MQHLASQQQEVLAVPQAPEAQALQAVDFGQVAMHDDPEHGAEQACPCPQTLEQGDAAQASFSLQQVVAQVHTALM